MPEENEQQIQYSCYMLLQHHVTTERPATTAEPKFSSNETEPAQGDTLQYITNGRFWGSLMSLKTQGQEVSSEQKAKKFIAQNKEAHSTEVSQ